MKTILRKISALLILFLIFQTSCNPVNSKPPFASPSPTRLPAISTIQSPTQVGETATPSATPNLPMTFAVIGDYGMGNENERKVADLVLSWQPDLIITTGDDNYPDGSTKTIDRNIGQYYHSYIFPYDGSYGAGASENRFFPSLGNHDWVTDNAQPYLDYFSLPGNERYYSFQHGPVTFFAIDSDSHEPDKVDQNSIQAEWLHQQLTLSTTPWNIVYFHHPPYSSGMHGPNVWMQWPFKEWGADLVLSGHDHTYERLQIDNLTYIVNGLGGAREYDFGKPLDGSLVRYNQEIGAMLVEATAESLRIQFFNVSTEIVDDTQVNATP